jgi:predicted phosphoribosyltransferase
MNVLYRDRADAGVTLAGLLGHYAGRDDVLVLGLPRGGVPVAYQVARALGGPLDVFLVRKLGVPGREELAMGAIASGGVQVINRQLVEGLGIPVAVIERTIEAEQRELDRRERAYREDRPPPQVEGKVVVLVDDGLATGSTMRAAIGAVRRLGPARLVVAVPTAPAVTCQELRHEADEVICASTPPRFRAVGLSYRQFPQVSDEEVRQLLRRARSAPVAPDPAE